MVLTALILVVSKLKGLNIFHNGIYSISFRDQHLLVTKNKAGCYQKKKLVIGFTRTKKASQVFLMVNLQQSGLICFKHKLIRDLVIFF